jgi:hypothetical protein
MRRAKIRDRIALQASASSASWRTNRRQPPVSSLLVAHTLVPGGVCGGSPGGGSWPGAVTAWSHLVTFAADSGFHDMRAAKDFSIPLFQYIDITSRLPTAYPGRRPWSEDRLHRFHAVFPASNAGGSGRLLGRRPVPDQLHGQETVDDPVVWGIITHCARVPATHRACCTPTRTRQDGPRAGTAARAVLDHRRSRTDGLSPDAPWPFISSPHGRQVL